MSFRFNFKVGKSLPVHFEIEQPKFQCTLSQNMFCGACQITACHANIGSQAHPSSCIYLFYNNKKQEFDKYDVMYALNLKDKSYRNAYQTGFQKTTTLVTLYRILQHLREVNKHTQCIKCGIFTEREHCHEDSSCRKRQNLMQGVIECSNLKFPEIRGRLQDMYILIRGLPQIREYLRLSKSDYKPELWDLFGLSPTVFEQLQKIPTQETKDLENV